MSRTRIERGLSKGSNNPNYGVKDRPWLEGDRHPLRRWHQSNPDFGDKQRGENNPIHKVSHLYGDPEFVSTITRGIRAHTQAKRGQSYESVYGPEKAAEYKDKLRRASPERLSKFRRRTTVPEQKVREMLERLGVPFTAEAPFGYHTVDFLLEGPKIIIQADGDYWHAHPEIYGDGLRPLSKQQEHRRRLDASADTYARHRGYLVLRFWERDLSNDFEQCFNRLKVVLGERNKEDIYDG